MSEAELKAKLTATYTIGNDKYAIGNDIKVLAERYLDQYEVSETDCDYIAKKIDEAVKDIEEAKFDINPKALSNDSSVTGCSYCPYKDICFRKNIDIEVIDKQNDLSFLEEFKGDQDE